MRRCLVLGAGGFIGHHMVKRLKAEGVYVVGADRKEPEFEKSSADRFETVDLRYSESLAYFTDDRYDEVYQFAADMGGAGYVFTGKHDLDIMLNSTQINLNVIDWAIGYKPKKLFFSSSACIYPERNQLDPDNPVCREDSAYPADPDSEYGWEKLYAERLYNQLWQHSDVEVYIGRFHNIYGPLGAYKGGREKAPAAICRKAIEAEEFVEIWGDGNQTRSFLYIDDCIEAVRRLVDSNYHNPINIGSEQMITINDLAQWAIDLTGKKLGIKHIPGPTGVRGRTSDNNVIKQVLDWTPRYDIKTGLAKTFMWIHEQINGNS